jgi:hypothetical protein
MLHKKYFLTIDIKQNICVITKSVMNLVSGINNDLESIVYHGLCSLNCPFGTKKKGDFGANYRDKASC